MVYNNESERPPHWRRGQPEERLPMTANHFRSLTRRAAATLLALLLVATTSHWALAQSATVRLVIDYGDGAVKIFTDLPWSKGTTVLDVMNAAQGRPHGITFKQTGSGAALLTQIDDVA